MLPEEMRLHSCNRRKQLCILLQQLCMLAEDDFNLNQNKIPFICFPIYLPISIQNPHVWCWYPGCTSRSFHGAMEDKWIITGKQPNLSLKWWTCLWSYYLYPSGADEGQSLHPIPHMSHQNWLTLPYLLHQVASEAACRYVAALPALLTYVPKEHAFSLPSSCRLLLLVLWHPGIPIHTCLSASTATSAGMHQACSTTSIFIPWRAVLWHGSAACLGYPVLLHVSQMLKCSMLMRWVYVS